MVRHFRRKALPIGFGLFGVAGLSALALYVQGNTRFELSQGDGLAVNTRFPGATCTVTLEREFMFVGFGCEEDAEDSSNPGEITK